MIARNDIKCDKDSKFNFRDLSIVILGDRDTVYGPTGRPYRPTSRSIYLTQYQNKSIFKVKFGIVIIFGIISSNYFVNNRVIYLK